VTSPIAIDILASGEISEVLPALAALRIRVFRDWPYLYDGDPGYERAYLQTYITSPRAAVIVARDGDAIIGASTCLPLASETANVQKPFLDAGREVRDIFYFGESVLDTKYRGRGIGVRFFDLREAHARSFHSYTTAAFCAVQRPDDHPMRPPGYTKLDAFWMRRGYARQPGLQCRMSWRDLGEAEESEKTLTFWTKTL
jgi:GNAT superfamily N-acetyltransferase